jgi:hypothetical protein
VEEALMNTNTVDFFETVQNSKFSLRRLDLAMQQNLAVDIRKMLNAAIKKCFGNNADFIYWLAQYDERRLFLEDGYCSAYDFLVRGQGFSEGSAWRRIRVARLALQQPQILSSIAEGLWSFTVLAIIAQADLKSDELQKALTQCQRKTKKEAERIIALMKSRPSSDSKKRDAVRIVGSKIREPMIGCEAGTVPNASTSETVGSGDSAIFDNGGCVQDQQWPDDKKASFQEFAVHGFSDGTKGTSAEESHTNGEVCGVFADDIALQAAGQRVGDRQSPVHADAEKRELIYRVSMDLPENVYERLIHAKTLCQADCLAELISKLLEIYASKLPDYKRKTFGLTANSEPVKAKSHAGVAPSKNVSDVAEEGVRHREVRPVGPEDSSTATGGGVGKTLGKIENCLNTATGGGVGKTLGKIENCLNTATGGGVGKTFGKIANCLEGTTGGDGQDLIESPKKLEKFAQSLSSEFGKEVRVRINTRQTAEKSNDNNVVSSVKMENIAVRSRYIPRHVRRLVWEKCGGTCGFISPTTGRRCGSADRLEFEHIRPFAKGGSHTADNLMLLCRAHNQFQAVRHFGNEKMLGFKLAQ